MKRNERMNHSNEQKSEDARMLEFTEHMLAINVQAITGLIQKSINSAGLM